MSTRRSPRAARIVNNAAIAILAGRGMRGLTHRAVDEAAGLPSGTTSNYAPTRAALIELSLARMTELEIADIFGAAADRWGSRPVRCPFPAYLVCPPPPLPVLPRVGST